MMPPTPMSGIFNAPHMGGAPSAQTGPTSGFMPVGSPTGPQPSAQGPTMGANSMMPPGNPGGQPMQPSGQMPGQAPMTMPSIQPRPPISDPNNNFLMSALQDGSQPPQMQTPGTPNANTPGINMQNTPTFSNFARSGSNAPSDANSQQLQALLGH